MLVGSSNEGARDRIDELEQPPDIGREIVAFAELAQNFMLALMAALSAARASSHTLIRARESRAAAS